jgi:hemolysin III
MKTTYETFAAEKPLYTIGEEITNAILHGIGALAAIAGLVLLSMKTTGFLGGQRTDNMDIVAVVIYAASMFAMFLTSTLYHSIQHQGAKIVLRKLDHSLIFIFIAGTYTPFCLIALRGIWGWSIFAFEWVLAALGIILHSVGSKSFKKIEIATYILMGWAIIVGFIPLVRAIPLVSVIFLLAGGVAYTLGVLWYRKKDVKFTHVVWHIFVLAGTVCHWFAVWYML